VGEFANAIVCLQQQQHHVPDDGVIYDNIAWCQMKLGWLDDALANAREALTRVPDRSDVHHDHAAILFLRSQLHEALEATSRALAECSDPVVQLYYLHALVLDRAGAADEAVAAWLQYLNRARGQPAHRKAVRRAVAALRTSGHSYSVTQYAIRAIAEQMIVEIGGHVESVRNLLRQHDVSVHRLGDLERSVATSGWSNMEALENSCRDLFDESERILTSQVLLGEKGRRGLKAIFRKMRDDQEKDQIPYHWLLRGGVCALLRAISTQKPYWAHLRALSQHQAAVDRVVEVSRWMECRDELKRQYGSGPAPEALQRLLNSWQEQPRQETPGVSICLADILQGLRDRLPVDVVDTIGASDGAFGTEENRRVRQTYETQAAAANEAITQAQQRHEEAERAAQEKENRLRGESQKADRQATAWGEAKQDAVAAILAAQPIKTSLTYCAGVKKATGFWATLTGRTKRIRQVNLGVSQLAQQINRALRDLPPPLCHSEDPEATLTHLQHQIPGWLESVLPRLAARVEESNRHMENWREVKRKAEGAIEGLQQEVKRERHQTSEVQKQQTEHRDRARQVVDALKRFEEEVPGYGFFAAKDIVALAVLNDPKTLFCYAGLTDHPIALRSLDPAQRETLPGHAGGVASLAVAPSGVWMASAGLDGQAKLWSVEPPALRQRVSVGSPAYSVTFGGEWLFVGTDERIETYSMPELKSVQTLNVEGMVWGLAFDWERQRLYAITASFEDPLGTAVYVWQMRTTGPALQLTQRLRGFDGLGLSLACDPAGRWLAAGEGRGSPQAPEPSRVLVWDATTLRLKRVFSCHSGWVEAVAFSPDGRWLVSGDTAGAIATPTPSTLFLHDVEANRTALALEAHVGWVRSLAFDREGGLLLSGGSDGVWVWDFPKLNARADTPEAPH